MAWHEPRAMRAYSTGLGATLPPPRASGSSTVTRWPEPVNDATSVTPTSSCCELKTAWAFFASAATADLVASITSMTDMNNFLSLGFVRVRWTFGDPSARSRADGVGGRYLRPQPEAGGDPVGVAVVGGQVFQGDDVGVGQPDLPQRVDVVFADGARAEGKDRGIPDDLVEAGASRPAGQGVIGQPGDELIGYALELELVAGARSAVRRLVDHRGHVHDRVLLGLRQARLKLIDHLVQPQPLVDELGMEAAELGVLGRLPEAPCLPVVGPLEEPAPFPG